MRKENWFEELSAYLDRVRDKPFKWGEHDCCIFTGACVEAMTGVDYLAPYLGYKTKTGAKKALKGITLLKTLTKLFGKPVPVACAHRGDIMYIVTDDGPCIGICLGETAVFVGREGSNEGLVTLPRADCSRAFRVEF